MREILFANFLIIHGIQGMQGQQKVTSKGELMTQKRFTFLLSTRGQSEGWGWEIKALDLILSVHQLKELGGSTLPVDRRSSPSATGKNDSSWFHPFAHSFTLGEHLLCVRSRGQF